MARAVLIYDDTCGFCTRGVRRLRRLAGGLDAVGSRTPEALALLPGLARDDFERRMYLVVGEQHYGGAEAIARCLVLSRWLAPAGWLYYVPGVRQLADAAYRWTAARRHRLGAACRRQ